LWDLAIQLTGVDPAIDSCVLLLLWTWPLPNPYPASSIHLLLLLLLVLLLFQFAEDPGRAQELWDLATQLTGVDTADNLK
jgi:hypothetical protein